MFTEKDILARLQNGEDLQKIADEMAAIINAANKTYSDQKAAEEAKKKAEEERKKQLEVQKKEELQDIVDAFHIWLDTYYEIEDLDKIFEEIDADAMLEVIASVEEYIKAMVDLKNVLQPKTPVKKSAAPIGTKVLKTQNPDETLNAFLKNMGW